MRKGRIVAIDEIDGRKAAALLQDGRLQDLLIDPLHDRPRPSAIYRAKATQPMKGQNGIILDLGQGQKGFLKQAKGIASGASLLVQVSTHAEIG
ncbi:MAG: ribonuclease G, partial [Amylibacter sp.]